MSFPSTEQEWIDSKELLKITGISRATLNNYIKSGLVPRPVVKKPLEGAGRTRKIGYFSYLVLDRIEKIKQLKKRGDSMEMIAQQFRAMPVTEPVPQNNRLDMPWPSRNESNIIGKPPPIAEKTLTFNIEDIKAPAYLLNYQFEIEWINKAAEVEIFNQSVKAIKDPDLRNAFRLFFKWEFTSYLKNWETLVDFHVSFMKSGHPIDYIEKLYPGISEQEIRFLKKAYERVSAIPRELVNQSHICLVKGKKIKQSYKIHATFFREGVLFVYVPTDSLLDGIAEFLANRRKVINDLLQRRLPTQISFCVLVADLQDSIRLCAELPPEEYFQLINQLWTTLEALFKKYYGIYGKQVGNRIEYYFLKEQDSDYIINAIHCALELKDKMRKLSDEWKMLKHWYNELYLNIGISEGYEYFSPILIPTSIAFEAQGEAVNCAERLSQFASNGGIFTAKNLINNLKEEDRRKFRFGVRRKVEDCKMFIENSFSRVIDLLGPEDPKFGKFTDVAMLPVTEITSVTI